MGSLQFTGPALSSLKLSSAICVCSVLSTPWHLSFTHSLLFLMVFNSLKFEIDIIWALVIPTIWEGDFQIMAPPSSDINTCWESVVMERIKFIKAYFSKSTLSSCRCFVEVQCITRGDDIKATVCKLLSVIQIPVGKLGDNFGHHKFLLNSSKFL